MRGKHLVNAFTIGASLFSVMATSAPAATIDFEEIASPGSVYFLAPGYQGLTWSGGLGEISWVIADSANNFSLGFSGIVAHSGQNFAWSNNAVNLSIQGNSFDFNNFWARAGRDSFTATAHGFVGATEIYTQLFTVSDIYQEYVFNFSSIDRLEITNQNTNLLVDDIMINVTAPIPEPETYMLMLTGLGLLSAVTSHNRARQLSSR